MYSILGIRNIIVNTFFWYYITSDTYTPTELTKYI